MNTFKQEILSLNDRLIALRRELHQWPEIGSELPYTRAIVCRELDQLGIPYSLNPEDDGLVAEIKGTKPGKTIAFRADMDALHIEEAAELPFRSNIPGQMHGCGHDAHTAVLLVTAAVLQQHRDQLSGSVRLLFQSGEETGTGAKQMLAQGALEGVDAICALHVGNLAGDDRTPGDLVVLPGPVTAGKDKFAITVLGKGTHSAFPEKGVDPILIASRIANACEEIAARELPAGTAAVISFGSLQAGCDHNTIPESATLLGSIRVQDDDIRDFIGNRIQCIAKHLAAAFRAEAVVNLKKGSRTVMNDPELAQLVAEASAEVLGPDKVVTNISAALMGSDDFANYAAKIPGVYFFLHTNNPEKEITQANHNPQFDVDEEVLWEGVAALVATAMKYLNR